MTKIPLGFIAGPFRADTAWGVAENVRAAERIGLEVAKLGIFPVIPHANSHLFLGQLEEESFWLPGYQLLMDRCDCLVLLPGWTNSAGTKAEHSRWVRTRDPGLIFDTTTASVGDRVRAFVAAFKKAV